MAPTHKLQLAPDLTLPADAVTQRLAWLGRIGTGKSYGATKLAELMFDIRAQFVALDPVGIWYGLRVDGKGKGLPIPVFGGLHGDVPLEPTSGELIADLVVDRSLSCVIDVSQFEHDAEKARFAAAFARRFFWRKKSKPSAVHLFIEECQEFLNQEPQKGEQQMVHDFVRMAKIGRNFGIGMSLISQRPQEVSKKALNLTECLFAFQMTGAHERRSVRDWVSSKGADDSIDVMQSLPKLKVAHAHVYSPQWLAISLRTIKTFEKRSADVSSTPVVGDAPAPTIALTPIDLGELRDRMAASIEKAKQEDPKELRNTIAKQSHTIRTLERQIANTAPVVDDAAVRAAVAAAGRQWASEIKRAAESDMRALDTSIGALIHRLGEIVDGTLPALRGAYSSLKATLTPIGTSVTIEPPVKPRTFFLNEAHELPQKPTPARKVDATQAQSDPSLSPSAQKLLNAAARLASVNISEPTRAQLAAVAGVSSTSSTTDTAFGKLTKAGYLENVAGGAVRMTQYGSTHAARVDSPPTLQQYHNEWRLLLGEGSERKLFDAYLGQGNDSIPRVELCARAQVSSSSSTTDTAFGKLTGLELLQVAGKGEVKAGRTLFPEGLE